MRKIYCLIILIICFLNTNVYATYQMSNKLLEPVLKAQEKVLADILKKIAGHEKYIKNAVEKVIPALVAERDKQAVKVAEAKAKFGENSAQYAIAVIKYNQIVEALRFEREILVFYTAGLYVLKYDQKIATDEINKTKAEIADNKAKIEALKNSNAQLKFDIQTNRLIINDYEKELRNAETCEEEKSIQDKIDFKNRQIAEWEKQINENEGDIDHV